MGSCSQGTTFVSSTWNLDTLAQIGAAPAEHLRVAAEFLERIVNMGIKAIMGIKVAAVTNVAITTIRQGPGPSNLASKCQPRYSLVTKTTSPPCLARNTSDSCRVAEEERLKGWGSFKQSTSRIQMSLINRMTSRPCVLKSISFTQRNDGI